MASAPRYSCAWTSRAPFDHAMPRRPHRLAAEGPQENPVERHASHEQPRRDRQRHMMPFETRVVGENLSSAPAARPPPGIGISTGISPMRYFRNRAPQCPNRIRPRRASNTRRAGSSRRISSTIASESASSEERRQTTTASGSFPSSANIHRFSRSLIRVARALACRLGFSRGLGRNLQNPDPHQRQHRHRHAHRREPEVVHHPADHRRKKRLHQSIREREHRHSKAGPPRTEQIDRQRVEIRRKCTPTRRSSCSPRPPPAPRSASSEWPP